MRLWMLCSLVLFTGCATQTRYNIDMTMTELSDALDGATETVTAESSVEYGPFVSSGIWVSQHSTTGSAGFANNRVAVSSRSVFDLSTEPYQMSRGAEVSFTGGDDVHQFRAALFYHPARFRQGAVDGYNSPSVLGLDLGIHAIQQSDPVEFFIGLRATSAVLVYQFDAPVAVGYETFSGDSLGIFGLGVPLGMHLMAGNLSFEAVVTPSLYLHSVETALGADNDLVTWTQHTPVSLGVGYNW